jgi:hypothetical protein
MIYIYIVTCPLKAGILQSEETPVAREWFDRRHLTVATLTYARVEERLEAVFSMQSAAKDYDPKGSVKKYVK